MREREKLLKLRERVGCWTLRDAVRAARMLNRRISLHRNTGNVGAERAVLSACSTLAFELEGRRWEEIYFFQCPFSGFMVMKIPPFSYTADFLELEELMWETRIRNEGVGGPDVKGKKRALDRRIKNARLPKRFCKCGCGEVVYGKCEWVMGHNGRAEGWFRKGIIPPSLRSYYEKWKESQGGE